LVKLAKSKGINFTVRTGGHNAEGRSIRQDTLTIDMRALSSVDIATDRQSATIGGGCLMKGIATKLLQEGLATPLGTISSVGYVGWATYGGYGPFSPLWGLGVDQIISATVVNADGEIIKADSSMLKGIRGAGGFFGIIVDLTIKVHPATGVRISNAT
jgi:FAD/FMN-containing dehydrogenase